MPAPAVSTFLHSVIRDIYKYIYIYCIYIAGTLVYIIGALCWCISTAVLCTRLHFAANPRIKIGGPCLLIYHDKVGCPVSNLLIPS